MQSVLDSKRCVVSRIISTKRSRSGRRHPHTWGPEPTVKDRCSVGILPSLQRIDSTVRTLFLWAISTVGRLWSGWLRISRPAVGKGEGSARGSFLDGLGWVAEGVGVAGGGGGVTMGGGVQTAGKRGGGAC